MNSAEVWLFGRGREREGLRNANHSWKGGGMDVRLLALPEKPGRGVGTSITTGEQPYEARKRAPGAPGSSVVHQIYESWPWESVWEPWEALYNRWSIVRKQINWACLQVEVEQIISWKWQKASQRAA